MARREGSESVASIGSASRIWIFSMIAIAGSLAILGTMGVFSDAAEGISDGESDDSESEHVHAYVIRDTLPSGVWEYCKCGSARLVEPFYPPRGS